MTTCKIKASYVWCSWIERLKWRHLSCITWQFSRAMLLRNYLLHLLHVGQTCGLYFIVYLLVILFHFWTFFSRNTSSFLSVSLTQLFFFFFLSSASLPRLPMLEWLAALLMLDILSEECCRLIRRSGDDRRTFFSVHRKHELLFADSSTQMILVV